MSTQMAYHPPLDGAFRLVIVNLSLCLRRTISKILASLETTFIPAAELTFNAERACMAPAARGAVRTLFVYSEDGMSFLFIHLYKPYYD